MEKIILYKNGVFYKDEFDKEELIINEIKEITKNSVILQTGKTGTIIKMLLRWKNHLGVLFYAWQISLCREA